MASLTSVATLTDDECADILCTALEGGIGYWCQAWDITRRDTNEAEDYVGWAYVSFEAHDAEATDEVFGMVDYETVRRGCNLILAGNVVSPYITQMVFRHFSEDEAMDADGADCVVQLGLFGELVYG